MTRSSLDFSSSTRREKDIPMPSAPTEFDKELDRSIVTGFLYGIESDRLSGEEIKLRVEAFRHTAGYQTAFRAAKQSVEKYVIGEYNAYSTTDPIKNVEVQIENLKMTKQRKALWGTK